MLCVAIIAIPLFGILAKKASPDANEYMHHRLIFSAACFLVFSTSFFFNKVKVHLVTATCWLVLALNLWAIWITYVNDFSIDYTIGLFTTFCVLNITTRRPKLNLVITSLTILATVMAALLAPQPIIQPGLIIFASLAFGVAFMMTARATLYYERKLSILNQTLERKVQERTAEAEERAIQLAVKNRELEQFAYVASHDLKSPLRNISSFIQLIQRKLNNHPDLELDEYLSFVVTAVKKMNAIIDDVLLYSRYGDRTLYFQNNSIWAIIQDASHMVNPEMQKKMGNIRFDNAIDKIACDRPQIEQLFRNILENALKYNTTEEPEINISVTEHETEYLFAVKDNGIGIPEEFHSKIFTMFKRLHTDKEYSGTGIGLAICKRIVENHQGKIWVESKLGEGTTFFFTISKQLQVLKPNFVLEKAMN